jgi:hypothetical protein
MADGAELPGDPTDELPPYYWALVDMFGNHPSPRF